MKATVRIGDLRTAVDRVMLAAERRSTIPILSCLFLSVTATGIKVQGTNLDMMVTATCPVLSSEGGRVCVNAQRLAALLRALPGDQEATLTETGNRVTVDVPEGRFAFLAVPAKDWPELSVGETATSLDVPLPSLANAIARLTPFICTEEARYYLNGIHFHVKDGRVVAVATDGHRLGVVPVEIDAAAFGDRKIIVPRAAIRVLASMLRRRDEKTVRVEFHGDAKGILRASFVLDGVRLDTKLIDGTFPEYQRVFPQKVAVEMEADIAPLLHAARRLAPFAGRGDGAFLHVPAAGQASIAAGQTDDGAILAVPVRRLSGAEDVRIGFNLDYLRAVLQAAGGVSVRMRFDDAGAPMMFLPGDGGTFLLMPMRFVETMFTALPDGAGLARAA